MAKDGKADDFAEKRKAALARLAGMDKAGDELVQDLGTDGVRRLQSKASDAVDKDPKRAASQLRRWMRKG